MASKMPQSPSKGKRKAGEADANTDGADEPHAAAKKPGLAKAKAACVGLTAPNAVPLEGLKSDSEVVVLTLSGSLSPVHLGHVRCLEAAAEVLRGQGKCVAHGYLAPSSEEYVMGKLGDDALSLADRVHLSELAVSSISWLGVDESGDMSSTSVCRRAEAALREKAPHVRWIGWQVVGEDFARRCELWKHASAEKRYVCIPRSDAVANSHADVPLPQSSEYFVVAPADSVYQVSSTCIRELARASRWDELSCHLHPDVAATLRARRWLSCVLPELPEVLPEPLIYLSANQSDICLGYASLAPLASQLPGWVPHRLIADALGHGTRAIDGVLARIGRPYVWATEFENVHSMWRFDEPPIVIDGTTHECSEMYYHSCKPTPFVEEVWEAQKVGVMRKAVRAKLAASAEVCRLLRSTHPHPLVSIKPDAVWGVHPETCQGKNLLAALLEEARAELLCVATD